MRNESEWNARCTGRAGISVLECVLGLVVMGILGFVGLTMLRRDVSPEVASAAGGLPLKAGESARLTPVALSAAAPVDTAMRESETNEWDVFDTALVAHTAEEEAADAHRSGDLYSSEGGWDTDPDLPGAQSGGTARKQDARLQALRDAIDAGTINPRDIKNMFQAVALEDITDALGEITAMEWGPHADSLFQGLMARWGELDPGSALEYAAGIGSRLTRNAAVRNALISWGKMDPDAALGWMSSSPDIDADAVKSSIRPFFQAMARSNPEWALANIWSLPDTDMQRTAAYTVVKDLSKHADATEMTQWFGQMANSPDREILAEAMVSVWTPYQPELAAQWTEALRGSEGYTRSVDQLVSSWSGNEPEAAGDWIMGLADEDLRRRELNRLTSTWVRTDLEAASEWLGQYPPSRETDPAVSTLVRSTMKLDPGNAMTWADSVTSVGLRQSLMFQVGREWMKTDPGAASAYIVAADMPVSQKERLLALRH